MVFAIIYLISLAINLSFIYKYKVKDREGMAVVVAVAFMPIVNVIMAAMCVCSFIEDYFWRE